MAARILVHQAGRDRPVVVQIDLEQGAAAPNLGVVVVLLDELVVVDGDAAGLRQEAARAGHVVDIAGILFIEADDAQRGLLRQRDVDHPFHLAAGATLVDLVQLHIHAAVIARGIGLVGDDADRAGFRRGAIERALRAGEAFDAGDVVDVHVKVAADRGDRLFIEIDANRGQRTGVVAIPARGDAAHVDDVGARRARALRDDGRQLLGIAVEVRNIELVKLLRAQRLDRNRHVLEVFRTLLRGHDDHVATAGIGRRLGRCILRHRNAGRSQERGAGHQQKTRETRRGNTHA